LAFPEVFGDADHPGFDGMIGNPPFMGGPKISGTHGDDYREYLVRNVAGGVRGLADLVTYFVLRATQLSRGAGFIATKSVAEGDSRVVGLQQITSSWTIHRALKSRPWPGTQSVFVSLIWFASYWHGDLVLDGRTVAGISSALETVSRASGDPKQLAERRGQSFEGFKSDGIGFILAKDEARGLLSQDASLVSVIRPWLTGEDLNQRPNQDPSRYAIFFSDMSLSQVQREYAVPLELVRERVKPYRDGVKRKANRERWWQFAETRPGLRAAIHGLERYLVITHHSKTITPVFIPAGWLPSHALVVFALDGYFDLGVLTSSLHWWWALRHGSKLKNDPRYTSTTCFETFPQPGPSDAVSAAGMALDEHRASLMAASQEGLTTTYIRLHSRTDDSPGIRELRRLHAVLDLAVRDAYGWSDLDLDPGFHDTPQGPRFTLGPTARVEILDRLLELNQQRYAKEVEAGLHTQRRRASRSRPADNHPELSL